MTRVKMNARHEYEFVANFKVLQNVFKAKKIDKVCVCMLDDVPDVPAHAMHSPYSSKGS